MMISSVRKRVKGPLAYIIIAIIIVPFALVGLDSYVKRDIPGIHVGEEFISNSGIKNEFDQRLRDIPGSENYKENEKSIFYNMIESRFIMEAMLGHYADEIGIYVDDKSISHYIKQQDYFNGENGKFDVAKYRSVLDNNRLSASQYEEIIRNKLRKDKVSKLLFLNEPKSLSAASELMNTRIELDIAEIMLTELERHSILPPTQGDIRQYYQAEKGRKYQTEPKKDIEYVFVDRDYIIMDLHPSEEDLKDRYNEYVNRENRDVKYTFANKIFNNLEDAKEYNFPDEIGEDLMMENVNAADLGESLSKALPGMNIGHEEALETEFGIMKVRLIAKTKAKVDEYELKKEALLEEYLSEVYDLGLDRAIEDLKNDAYENSMEDVADKTSSEVKKVSFIGENPDKSKIDSDLLTEMVSSVDGDVGAIEANEGMYVYKVVRYEPPFDKNIDDPEVLSDIKESLMVLYGVLKKIEKAKIPADDGYEKIDISVSMFDNEHPLKKKILEKIKANPVQESGYVEDNNLVYSYKVGKVYKPKESKGHQEKMSGIQSAERTIRFEKNFKEEFNYERVK